MEILKTFGVQPILLIAQIVNFLLLLFLLQRFLYKPILKVLDERKTKIAESLKNADEIERRLKLLEDEREMRLKEVNKEAKKVLDEASKMAHKVIEDAHAKAAEDAQLLIKKTKRTLELEREEMYQQMREEIADLVALGLQKIIGKTLTEKDKKQFLEESIKSLGS